MQEKIKVVKKTNSEFVEFVSIPQKLHPFKKNHHRLPTEPMEIHHSPHTHTIPIPMGIPMGIPIPTAGLVIRHIADTALLEWVSEYAVRAYTTADSAVSYLNHARIA